MTRSRHAYYITVSVVRLVDLLREAGFVVEPPRDLAAGVVQLVSDPQGEGLSLQRLVMGRDAQVLMAEELTGRRVVEVPPAGQYL